MKWELFRELFLGKFCTARGLSARTIATYGEVLDEFKSYLDIEKKGLGVADVVTVDICDFIEHLRKFRCNCGSTVNKKVTVLKAFYRAMVSLDVIQPNQDPCARLPAMRKPQEKVGDILSIQEIEKLAAAPDNTTIMGLSLIHI